MIDPSLPLLIALTGTQTASGRNPHANFSCQNLRQQRKSNAMLKEFDLPLFAPAAANAARPRDIFADLRTFSEFGEKTREFETQSSDESISVPSFVNEFWTAGQRQADNLHEVSYRACFKPQVPRFFIERLTAPGDVVYDPFMGRGTTLLEGALLGRVPYGNDINPLSRILIKPRLNPPSLSAIAKRLGEIEWGREGEPVREDLLVFYHLETLREISALKAHLVAKAAAGTLDGVDEWIRMVAINRLTGHSPGFFSVYTLPPNQAVAIKSQIKINEKRKQIPPRRDVPKLILKKSRGLLKDFTSETAKTLGAVAKRALLTTAVAAKTSEIPSNSVSLVVTSPPFLDVVNYALDNWLRCWFAGIDPQSVAITMSAKVRDWQSEMTAVFTELQRLLKPGGHVAFEVGEVRGGKVKLEQTVLTCARDAGLNPLLVLINEQEFTKTANCWGVDNNTKGTNSNRIVLLQKP
jgi:DNA modification methylase